MGPSSTEPELVASFACGALFQLCVALLLHAWGRWVARRRGGTRGWRFASWMPVGAFALSVLGIGLSSWMLVRAFDVLAGTSPAHKAEALSSAIADAMNVTAALVVPSWGLYLASVVAFLAGSVMPRAPEQAAPGPDEPAPRTAGDPE